MSTEHPQKKPVRVHVEWPALSAPNDGYDENGLWNGMTPEQVREWLNETRRELFRMWLEAHIKRVVEQGESE